MRFGACGREKEVAEMLARGHWPEAASGELRSHVQGCRGCRDLVLVKHAFRAERTAAAAAARLEPPGVLWWRAQLRRRNAALARIGKPILGAQIFSVAVTLAAAIFYLAWQARRGYGWPAWLQQFPRALHLEALLPDAFTRYPGGTLLVCSCLAMVALMSGVIVYMASEKH
jgi:hypothetical protein